MLEPIAGRATLGPTDYVRATAGSSSWRALKVYALMCIGSPWLMWQAWRQGDPGSALKVGGFTALMLGLLALGPLLERRVAKRMAAVETALELDANGVCVTTPQGRSRFGWAEVREFVELPEMFLLYVNPALPQIVLKRAFAEPEVERLRAFLQAKLKRRKP